MALNVYTGNHTSELVGHLGGLLRENTSVFGKDTVVVQSKPMQSWLNLELARKNGISANVDFPFPNRVVTQLLSSVTSDIPDEAQWKWNLFNALDSCAEPKVAAYLEDDASMLK